MKKFIGIFLVFISCFVIDMAIAGPCETSGDGISLLNHIGLIISNYDREEAFDVKVFSVESNGDLTLINSKARRDGYTLLLNPQCRYLIEFNNGAITKCLDITPSKNRCHYWKRLYINFHNTNYAAEYNIAKRKLCLY